MAGVATAAALHARVYFRVGVKHTCQEALSAGTHGSAATVALFLDDKEGRVYRQVGILVVQHRCLAVGISNYIAARTRRRSGKKGVNVRTRKRTNWATCHP